MQNLKIEAADVGGIDREEREIPPGVTILSGRNATNRTSIMQAIATGYGVRKSTVREGEEEGEIRMTDPATEESYRCTLRDIRGTTTLDGDTVLQDDHQRRGAELFAFLLADNEIRSHVREGADRKGLRDFLMAPVDSDEIETKIVELKSERDDLETQLSDIERAKERVTELTEEKESVKEKIEKKEEELEEVRERINESSRDVDDVREEQKELDEALSDLEDLKEKRGKLERERDIAQKALNETQVDLQSAQASLAQAKASSPDISEDIEGRISELESEKRRLDEEASTLESIIKFNSDMLSGGVPEVAKELGGGELANGQERVDRVTEAITGEKVVCWTCGRKADTDSVRETVDVIKDIAQERRQSLSEVKTELRSLRDKESELRAHRTKLESERERIQNLEEKEEDRERRLEDIRDRLAEVEEDIKQQEAEVDAIEIPEDERETIDAQQQANTLERDIGRLEGRLDTIEGEIADLNDQADGQDTLEERVNEITDEIEDLRGTVEQKEKEVVERFNEAADDIYDRLGYENISRIWIERVHMEDTRGPTADTGMEVHVVREVDGAAAESTLETLSESERELVGIGLSLAGYVAHGIAEYCPVILMDSVESVDADRLDRLLEYMSDSAPFVISTSLPEDEEVLDNSYSRERFGAPEA